MRVPNVVVIPVTRATSTGKTYTINTRKVTFETVSKLVPTTKTKVDIVKHYLDSAIPAIATTTTATVK